MPNDKYTAAIALRGLANIEAMDWSWLRGRQVRICLDHADKVNERTKYRPGLKAAWDLHERLTILDVPALLVDQAEWEEGTDLNDVLQKEGAERTGQMLKYIEPWLIPGLPGKDEGLAKFGRRRVHLPSHDFHAYWKFRIRDDHTQVVTKFEMPDGDDEDQRPKIDYGDLCGFRVASLSRVTIQSATATMTGDPDAMPRVQFSVSVQTARHGTALQRKVYDDADLYNLTKWEKFGAIYSPANFKRMVNILERTAEIGSRRAVNFVGLAWRDGVLSLNEGPDCYFTEPDKQCPYAGLTFPSGTRDDARQVIEAFGATMKQNAGSILLAWSLGGHLKPFLGFWPHLQMQANKGAGKSTLIKKLERAIAFTMLSGQSLQTEFRLVTSVSHTTHPIGWEELSARRQDIIDKAVGLLQETYQYTVTRRGGDMTEYLLSSPVLLAGEDVPVRSLIGKLVRVELSGKKGKPIADTLPRFPVKEWLRFLASLDKARVLAKFEEAKAFCFEGSRASGSDDGAMRMTTNYAALLTGWWLLAEFAGLPDTWNNLPTDLLAEMNHHIGETSSDREPWVWITEILLSEIAAGQFFHPYKWDSEMDKEGQLHEVLCVRPAHVMDHISGKPALREKWNGLPVKSDRVYRKQLQGAGVIVKDPVEKTIKTVRNSHMVALGLKHMERYGLHATPSPIGVGDHD
ncbi:toprim domain-containing protein [Andreprevotia chitinilytica]|uniref:toprim domain-containing protein n=1 Tax=Andreprevotia chitinilytica TaxID=396808 RepID=UPI00068F59CF|nr:toprim domain-containing protein [Andreprevotia chitinilytica]